LLACNTATAVSIRYLQNDFLPKKYPNKKILGIITPILESINFNNDKQVNIGILATPATISSNFYQQELSFLGYQNSFGIPCFGLAGAIEINNIQKINQSLELCLAQNLKTLKKLDIIVLACTHYPLIKKEISKKIFELSNQNIPIFDSNEQIANSLNDYFKRNPTFKPKQGATKIIASKNTEEFLILAKKIFKNELSFIQAFG
jgi:glutamate racemase